MFPGEIKSLKKISKLQQLTITHVAGDPHLGACWWPGNEGAGASAGMMPTVSIADYKAHKTTEYMRDSGF